MEECLISYCTSKATGSEGLLCLHHQALQDEPYGTKTPTLTEMGYVVWTLGSWYTLCNKNLCDGSEFVYDAYWLIACWEEDRKNGSPLSFGQYRSLVEDCSTLPMMAIDASTDQLLRIATPKEVIDSGVAWLESRFGIVESDNPAVDGPETFVYILPDGWVLPRELDDDSKPILPAKDAPMVTDIISTEELERVVCNHCFCTHVGEYDGNVDACDCHLQGMFMQPIPHDYVPDPGATPFVKSKAPPPAGSSHLGTPEPSHGSFTSIYSFKRRELRKPVSLPEIDAAVISAVADLKEVERRRRPLRIKKSITGRKKGSPPPSGTYLPIVAKGASGDAQIPAPAVRSLQQAIDDGDAYKLTWKKVNREGQPSTWSILMPGCRGILETLNYAVEVHDWPPGTEVVANQILPQLKPAMSAPYALGPDMVITLPDPRPKADP